MVVIEPQNPEYNFYENTSDVQGTPTTPATNSPATTPVTSNIVQTGGGSVINGGTLESPNFRPGVSGYRLDSNGNLEANDGNFRGAISAATIDIGGADASSFHVDIDGNIWSGAATYNIATNPFAVSNAGVIRSVSGTIGGWTLAATTLSATGIVLDSTNQKITVGSGSEITIDGVNKKIESSNYVSGVFGSGFHIDSDLLEVGNIAMRGMIRTAMFQKDVVSVMGGNFVVLDGDVLDADMTALDASTLTTKGNTTFAVGDILRIKDGVDDEWMEVVSNTPIDSYSESNYVTGSPMYSGSAVPIFGQSFTNTNSGTLDRCKFYLFKVGSPTGSAYATLYAHTGTYGVDGKPTGSILATSDAFDVSTLTTSPQLITFTFSGANRITLSASTYYCIDFTYTTGGDINNIVYIGFDNTSPTHSGIANYWNGSTWLNLARDYIFYIYAELSTSYVITRDKASAYVANNNPTWKKGATVVNYKQSGAGGVYMTASDTNSPYLSIFDHAGSPWSTINTRLRIGNLNGYLGYSTDLYGIAIGEATKYLKYDTTNGLRIAGAITASTIDIGTNGFHCDVNGNIWWGSSATYAGATIKISAAGSVNFTTGTFSGTLSAAAGTLGAITAGTLTGTTITGGTIRTAASGTRVEMSSANNRMDIYNSTPTNIGWFGGAGANGNFMYISQPDTNEDYPPIYITSAQDSNVINAICTNAGTANRPAFRFQSDNDSSEAMYITNSSNTMPTLGLSQSGTYLIIGTNVSGCYLDKAGTWTDASSKTLKENFETISVLDKLKGLKVLKYNYKVDGLLGAKKSATVKKWKKDDKKNGGTYKFKKADTSKKHISPMAEDMYKIFGVGDGVGLAAKDIAGVALQAIKELTQKVEQLEAKLK